VRSVQLLRENAPLRAGRRLVGAPSRHWKAAYFFAAALAGAEAAAVDLLPAVGFAAAALSALAFLASAAEAAFAAFLS
jgi:hypothetical protein